MARVRAVFNSKKKKASVTWHSTANIDALHTPIAPTTTSFSDLDLMLHASALCCRQSARLVRHHHQLGFHLRCAMATDAPTAPPLYNFGATVGECSSSTRLCCARSLACVRLTIATRRRRWRQRSQRRRRARSLVVAQTHTLTETTTPPPPTTDDNATVFGAARPGAKDKLCYDPALRVSAADGVRGGVCCSRTALAAAAAAPPPQRTHPHAPHAPQKTNKKQTTKKWPSGSTLSSLKASRASSTC